MIFNMTNGYFEIEFERESGEVVMIPARRVLGEWPSGDDVEILEAEVPVDVLAEYYAAVESRMDYAREAWATRRAESGYAQ